MTRVLAAAVLACAVAGLVAVSATATGDPYATLLAPGDSCGAAADAAVLDRATAARTMLCLTNYARSEAGLAPLRPSPLLARAGQAKLAADVACGEFSHTPCGKPFESVFAAYLRGTPSYTIGENIAWGTGSASTPRETMSGWLHSAGHRQNILARGYREIGIGYESVASFQGSDGATLWSQEFGVRS